MTNVLSEPEFLESGDARRAVHLFEERSLLQDLLARTTDNATVGGVQVLIGGEGEWEELKQCSVVLARYGIPGHGHRYAGRIWTDAHAVCPHHPDRPFHGRPVERPGI